MKKFLSKKLTGRLCAALTCGLLFTVGGQWEKAEAADALYAVTEGGASEITGVKAEGDTLILIGTTGNIPDNVKASDVVFTVSGETWNNVYGGIRSGSNSGDAINNSITISGGTVGNRVYGGVANPTDAKAENNTAVISGGTVGAVYGGYSFTGGAANLNRGIISGGKVNGDIYGGYAKVDSANKNQVIISGTADINTSDGVKRIYGGYSEAGNNTVDGNSVTIEGGTFTGAKEIYGGWTNGNGSAQGGTNGIAQNNTVTVKDGTFNHKVNIYGGYSGYGIASGNKAVINGGKVGNVYGGSSHSYASGNSVNISGGTIGDGSDFVYGGHGNSITERNEVNVSGGSVTIKGLYGGYTNNSMVISNVVNISGGSVTGSGRETIEGLGGGHTSYIYGTAEGNVVNISGGTFKDINIYGAYGEWAAKNNTVNISGGSFTNVGVYAAAGSDTDKSYGNTVNLIGKGGTLNVTLKVVPKLRADGTLDTTQAGTPLKGDVSNAGTALTLGDIKSVSTGNTLNIAGTDTTVTNVAGFQNVNFVITSTMKNGANMLIINSGGEATDFSSANVSVNAEAGANLQAGTVINLVHKVDGGALTLPEAGVTIQKSGVSASYATAGLDKLDADDIANDLVLTVKESVSIADNAELGANAKNMVETRAAGLAVVNEGVDFMAGQGLNQAKLAARSATAEGGNGFVPFAAMGGGNMRYNSGSHVDSKSWHGGVGVAKEIGDLTLGFAVGYGHSSFDSYNAGGVHGSGDSKGTGFTVLGQWQKDKGVHYEAALQAGRVKNDYSANLSGFDTHYDESSNYYGLTLGGGKEFALSDKNSVDVYGLYFWSHTNSSDTVTNHGDRMSFDAINSHRLRLGSRFTREVNKVSSLYAGLAWQYEFKGDARATINGQGAPSPSLKGHSGLLEIGWKANAGKNFTVDLGLNGWAGKQQGISGNVGFEWKF